MEKEQLNQSDIHRYGQRLAEKFCALSRRILRYANRGTPRVEFLREISEMLLDFSGCDCLELHMKDGNFCYRWETTRRPEQSFRFDVLQSWPNNENDIPADPPSQYFTKNGSFWTGDVEGFLASPEAPRVRALYSIIPCRNYKSFALIPFVVDDENNGFLLLNSLQRNYFKRHEIEFYEGVAQTLGLATADRRAQAALRERVKELTCLYGIAQIAERAEPSLEEALQSIALTLPHAWQYPDIALARIIFDGHSYSTEGYREGQHKQSTDIIVYGKKRGMVEVVYAKERPEFCEGPFLKEEKNLIEAVAREIARIVEKRETEKEKTSLYDQLRHADRLATIGQLAAGVAHELNEPLGGILGFAQLLEKCPDLPRQAQKDIKKIVDTSLYAREVVKKLLIFARQVPPQKAQLNLNRIVEEGLYFFESRCAKHGIELVRSLLPNPPEITADPAQMTQVLVNLLVNAIHAMQDGGRLTVKTLASNGHISLIVEDTGVGMDEDVAKKIFMPFFTTKKVSEGTGLGLSVVHGIVSSHGGTIMVDSKLGHGTRFEIQLPVGKANETAKE